MEQLYITVCLYLFARQRVSIRVTIRLDSWLGSDRAAEETTQTGVPILTCLGRLDVLGDNITFVNCSARVGNVCFGICKANIMLGSRIGGADLFCCVASFQRSSASSSMQEILLFLVVARAVRTKREGEVKLIRRTFAVTTFSSV